MCGHTRLGQVALVALCTWPIACEDSVAAPVPVPQASVRGRLATVPGNQRASPRLAASPAPAPARLSSIAVVRIDPPMKVIGRGVPDADGRFVVAGLPPTPGPVLVQAIQRDRTVLQALVPRLGDGSDVRSPPLSHETTIEAEAFLSLRAIGSDVDPILLQAWVTEELAAGVVDGSALAGALDATLQSYLDLARRTSGGRVPVSAFGAVLSEPWARLARSLDEAADPAAEDAAWMRFSAEVPGFLQAQLGVGGLDHVVATTAAAFTLRSALEADPTLASGADAAVALGAWHEAQASQALQAMVLAESPASELGAGLADAYARFFEALRRAVDRESVAVAEGVLAARIGGRGGAGTLLDALVAAENPGAPGAAAVAYVRSAGQEARVALDRALDDATRATDARGAIVSAFGALEGKIALAAHLQGGELGPAGRAFAVAAATSAHGGTSALVDLPVPADRVSIGGSLRAGLGLQSGASRLAAKLQPPSPLSATHARLVRLDGQGKRGFVATGRIDPASMRALLPRAPRGEELRVLELYDDSLRLVGGVIVPPALAGQRMLETAPITVETTAEALVLTELVRRAGRADLGLVLSSIDDATGAAVIAGDAAAVLAGALEVAQVVRARALGASIEKLGQLALGPYVELSDTLARTPGSARAAHARFDEALRLLVWRATGAGVDAQADATAEAAAALDALVPRHAGAQSILAAAVDARARLDNAGMGGAVVVDALSRLEPGGWIAGGLGALADQVARITSPAALPLAGRAFSLWLVGDGRLGGIDGVLEAYLDARYPGDLVLAAAYERAVLEVAGLALRWAVDEQALVDEAVAGVGAIDAPSLADALVARHAVFRKEALTAATLMGAGRLSERDAEVMARVLVAVAEGLYAAP